MNQPVGNVVIVGQKPARLYLWKITQAFQLYDEVIVKVIIRDFGTAVLVVDMLKKAYGVKEMEERVVRKEKTAQLNKLLEVINIRLSK